MSLGQWLGLFCIIAALYILWQIRQILLLAFTAVVLAIALNILVRKLTQLGLPRGVAVLLTVLTSLLAAILFFWLIVPPFADQFQKVIELLPSGFLRIRDWADDFRTRLPPWVPDLPTLSNLQQQLQPRGCPSPSKYQWCASIQTPSICICVILFAAVFCRMQV